jgi:hypothetical protein
MITDHEGCDHGITTTATKTNSTSSIRPVRRGALAAFRPRRSRAAPDYSGLIETAATVFSDWETRLAAGDTVLPGATLHRLLLNEGNGKFPLKIDAPGHYLVFEACGEHPLHINVGPIS